MRSLPSELKAFLWAFSLTNRRSTWMLVGMVSSPVWAIGIGLTFAIHSPSVITEVSQVRALALGAGYFVASSTVLWNVGNFLVQAKDEGTLHSCVLSNGRIPVMMFSRGIVSAAFTGPALAFSYAVVSSLLGFTPSVSNPLGALASFFMLHLALVALSMIVGSIFLRMRHAWIVINALQFLLPATSGMIPPDLFPSDLRPAIALSPFAHVFEVLRRAVVGSPAIPTGDPELTLTSALSVAALIAVGLLTLSITERSLRRRAF
ncbi:MAG: ABC transporter permease [Nitrososphaerota archaeon]|nr:ABC transporter permease [Nitrososphaerota archaeon]